MDDLLNASVRQLPAFDRAGLLDSGRDARVAVRNGSAADHIWAAINRRPGRVLAALIAIYLAIACAQAAAKLLWGDELITMAIARQGSLRAIWHALALGADPNPPLSHWMVMLSTGVFGEGALAVRLPAILCVLLAIVCMWAILRRWMGAGYAAPGVLAFMATRGFDYAYDARSYAPLMGFAMAGLALWLRSRDRSGRRRTLALAGMAAALGLGVSSNYYGVLAFFPIAAGEAVGLARRRRGPPGVWIALAAGALPLLAYLPLIRHNVAEFAPHAWNRPGVGMIADSYLVLVEGVFWPVLGLAGFALWRRRRRAQAVAQRMPAGEAAALAALLLYPFLGFGIAAAGAGMISPRCVAPVCCGFGMAAALLCKGVFGGNARAGVAVLCVALAWAAARQTACAIVLAQQRRAFFALRDEIARLPGSGPIVASDSLFVLPLEHYSSAEVRSRILFPVDFNAIHRVEKDDSGEQNLWAGRNGIFPVRIVGFGSALFPRSGFRLIGRRDGWLSQELQGDGFAVARGGSDTVDWGRLGGVFTPLAHEGTRILRVQPAPPSE